MTTLVQPVRGPAESQSADHAECGRLNDYAVALIVLPGVPFFWVPDGANEDQMASALVNAVPGVEIMADNANAVDLVAKWVPQGWYVIAQVYCNPWAVPVPPAQASADHWITLYGNGTAAPFYQCWDATYRTIANLRECSHQNDAHWHLIVKLPGASPVSAAQPLGGSAIQRRLLVGGSFKPGTRRWDNVGILSDGTKRVWHGWRDDVAKSAADTDHVEVLGGVDGGEEPSCSWSAPYDDAGHCILTAQVRGTDGHYYLDVFDEAVGHWSGWGMTTWIEGLA